jgi:hypothetical protein
MALFLHKYDTMSNTDVNNIYAEAIDANNQEQPRLIVHRDGSKQWFLNNKLHRTGAPATTWPNGTNFWYQHDKLHREDGPAVDYVDGNKQWYLHGKHYNDANEWAQAVLKMHNKPHDAAAVEDYLRRILTKDDLI